MRQLLLAAVVVLAGSTYPVARADKVEVKGVHLCCGACVKTVGNILKCTTDTGKVFELKNDAAKTKVNKVTVKDVHVCCNTCRTVIGELFKGTTITYEGKGTQRDVTIAGDNLEPAAVLQTLRNAGFTGTIQKQ